MANRTLPSNVEAERSVLGSMLISEEAATIALSSLNENSFSDVDSRNKIIFKAMVSLSKHTQPIDPQTVTNELVNTKLYDAAGGSDYLLTLMNTTINPVNIEYYVRIVKDQQVLRDYLLHLKNIEDSYFDGKVTDISEFLSVAQQKLGDIANQRSVGNFRKGGEIAREVKLQIEAESKRANKNLTGVDTGFRRLNELTHGWQAGDLIILAARPSVGKTALALNLAVNATKYKGQPVAIFSGEMSNSAIMKRIIASVSMVSIEQLSTGKMSERDMAKVSTAVDQIGSMNLYIDDRPNPKLGDIVAKSIKLKNQEPDLCAIFVDYVNIIKVDQPKESHSLEIADITSTLKELARNLKIPVIALSQINRDADKNENGEPSLSNLKDSGAIEQDADIVMLMYRKDYYDNQGKRIAKGMSTFEQKAEEQVAQAKAKTGDKDSISSTSVSIAKNRNGKTGKVTLLFSKALQRFDDISLEAEEAQRALDSNEGYGPSPDDE